MCRKLDNGENLAFMERPSLRRQLKFSKQGAAVYFRTKPERVTKTGARNHEKK